MIRVYRTARVIELKFFNKDSKHEFIQHNKKVIYSHDKFEVNLNQSVGFTFL